MDGVLWVQRGESCGWWGILVAIVENLRPISEFLVAWILSGLYTGGGGGSNRVLKTNL